MEIKMFLPIWFYCACRTFALPYYFYTDTKFKIWWDRGNMAVSVPISWVKMEEVIEKAAA